MNRLEQNSQIYLDTAAAFVDQVSRIPVSVYEQPALGVWNVRHLIAHTGRAMQTILDYLQHPTDRIDHSTASSYFHTVRQQAASEEIARRAITAAEPLRDGAADAMTELLARVTDALDAVQTDDDDQSPIIATPAGGMRVCTYLKVRILELTVHSLDLAGATGVPVDLPADALRITLQIESDVAVLDGRGGELALALAGRHPLDPGFSIF